MSNGVLGSSANFLPVEPVIGFSVQPLDRHFGPRRSRECKNNIAYLKPAAGVLEAGFLYILSFFPGEVGSFATDYFSWHPAMDLVAASAERASQQRTERLKPRVEP